MYANSSPWHDDMASSGSNVYSPPLVSYQSYNYQVFHCDLGDSNLMWVSMFNLGYQLGYVYGCKISCPTGITSFHANIDIYPN